MNHPSPSPGGPAKDALAPRPPPLENLRTSTGRIRWFVESRLSGSLGFTANSQRGMKPSFDRLDDVFDAPCQQSRAGRGSRLGLRPVAPQPARWAESLAGLQLTAVEASPQAIRASGTLAGSQSSLPSSGSD